MVLICIKRRLVIPPKESVHLLNRYGEINNRKNVARVGKLKGWVLSIWILIGRKWQKESLIRWKDE
jgi:hypothetical protein